MLPQFWFLLPSIILCIWLVAQLQVLSVCELQTFISAQHKCFVNDDVLASSAIPTGICGFWCYLSQQGGRVMRCNWKEHIMMLCNVILQALKRLIYGDRHATLSNATGSSIRRCRKPHITKQRVSMVAWASHHAHTQLKKKTDASSMAICKQNDYAAN